MLYQANSLKVSLREYLFEANLFTAPIVWLIAVITKLLRVRIPGSVDFPPVEGLSPFLVASGTIQGEIGEAIAAEKYWLEKEEFEHCGDFFLNDATSNTRYAGAVYLSPDGTTIAWVRVRRWPQLPPKAKATRVQFTSFGQDNSPIITTSANRDLLEPPAWQVKFYAGKPVAEVYAAHRTHISEVLRAQRPRVLLSPQDAVAHLDQLQAEFVDFQVSRGVFEPVNMPQIVSPPSYAVESNPIIPNPSIDNEQEPEPDYVIDHDGNVTAIADTAQRQSADQFLSDHRPAHQLPSSDDVLIAEVRRQETKQTQMFSKLLLLFVSLAVFAGVGGALWDWTFVLMIIPILFVHELGHLIAMKMFGYKNVNMFYIPFLGAAVTGRHHNVAGWKKAMVSLAGPLPSIVLAIMLETLGFVLEVEWLTQAALLMLVLNLFNLLPFMPLDGGWVAHITLFSRSKYLDIGFRAVTILVMFAATLLLQDRILLFLGIAMLIGLPAVWRSLKVQELLSREALPPPVADQIPAEAICRIAQVCQEAKMPAVNLTGLAAMTINVYEAVMARPTSWMATLGLWALHGGAIGLGLVGLLGFVFTSYASRFREMADLDFEVMQIEVPGEQREFHIGPGALPKPALLMWQFADEEQAAQAFASLKNSADSSTSRWGQTIFSSGSSDAVMDADADVETLTDMFSLPSKQELAARNAPQLNLLDQAFSPVQKRLFEQLPQMEVTFGSAEKQAQALKRLNELPQLDVAQQPLTEWALGRKPTASQQRLRRLLNVLLERVDELPWVTPAVAAQRPPEDTQPQNFDNMTSEEIDEFLEKEEEAMETRRAELRKLKLAWINAGLQRSKGETKQMIEAYLRYESDWHTFEQRQRERDFDMEVPQLEDYLATSLEALGYVDASAPEYRFGVNLFSYTPYDDEAFLDSEAGLEASEAGLEASEAGLEDTEEPVTEFRLFIDISSCIDSVATLSSLVDWLFEQGATAVRLRYERVVLPEELATVE